MIRALSVSAAVLHNAVRNVLGNLYIAVRLHYILSATLCLGTQVVGVAEHIRQRNKSLYLLGAVSVLKALYKTSAGVQVADYVAHVILGDDNYYLHDRL